MTLRRQRALCRRRVPPPWPAISRWPL